jgi:hypothetical protein
MTVPRTDVEALIASEKAIPNHRAKLLRYRARVFNGEISEATAGIEDVGLGEGLSGAGIEATCAGSAVIITWTIVRNFKVGKD